MCPSFFQYVKKASQNSPPVMAANKLNHFCRVGALRKYAGGIFLASDLGGYAAVASAVFTQRDWEKWVAEGRFCPGK